VAEARTLAIRVLESAGVPRGFAEEQADVLIHGELRGHPSHGLLRLSTLVERIHAGLIDPATSGRHRWPRSAFLLVDGANGLGPVVANRAIDAACECASQTGIAVAALRRTSHLGMLAPYAERVAQRGQCVIATCTSEALVHPWGGRTAMIGTNPLAIGVPAAPHPLIVDMSTGVVSMGKIVDHARRRAPIPAGWALDALGEPTTDAAAARTGSIAPFGGPKGYALGLALEVLVASVTGTALGASVKGTLDTDNPSTKGDLFLVIDSCPPAAEGEPVAPAIADLVSEYLQEVRESPAATSAEPVSVPGDRSVSRRELAAREGFDIDDGTLDELHRLAHNPPQRAQEAAR
jgi:L-2-hydroxycarboxylate dehydrogenase (NAD+)